MEDNKQQLNQSLIDQKGLKFGYLYRKLKDPKYSESTLIKTFLNCDYKWNKSTINAMYESCKNYTLTKLKEELLEIFPNAENIRPKRINGWLVLEYDLPAKTILLIKDRESEERKLYLMRSFNYHYGPAGPDESPTAAYLDKLDDVYPRDGDKIFFYILNKPLRKCLHYCSKSNLSILNYFGLFCDINYIEKYHDSTIIGGKYLGVKDTTWWNKLSLNVVSFMSKHPEIIVSKKALSTMTLFNSAYK